MARKDVNFLLDQFKLELSDPQYTEMVLQLEADTNFFKQNKLIDYSLLLGVSQVTDSEKSAIRSGGLQRARDESSLVFYSADKKVMYFLCIIDFLTSFTWMRKKAEYAIKKTFVSNDISCVPPEQYATRFREFMVKSILKVDNDQEESNPKSKKTVTFNFITSQ